MILINALCKDVNGSTSREREREGDERRIIRKRVA